MLRNECGGDATTYGGTTKITTTTTAVTQGSSSSTQIQWTGPGGDTAKSGTGNDMQRNHMLDAIAVGVVLFFFWVSVQRQTFPRSPIPFQHAGHGICMSCGLSLVGIYKQQNSNMLKFPESRLLWQGIRQVLWFLQQLQKHTPSILSVVVCQSDSNGDLVVAFLIVGCQRIREKAL